MIPRLYPYRNQLYPWCIVRLLPNAQMAIVARCRKRNDAEEHRRVLQRLVPSASFVIIFDAPPIDPDSRSLSISNLD
jgi:hypothetical protein